MAPTKKIIKEDTSAATTIAPGNNSGPKMPFGSGDDSMSRFQRVAAMISQVVTAPDAHLTKWYDQMMSYQHAAGHGMGVGDNSASNKASIEAKPSDANGTADHDVKMGFGGDDGTKARFNSIAEEDIAKLFEGQEALPAEFKEKAKILFETALNARVALAHAEIETAAEQALDEQIKEIGEQVAKNNETYIQYVAEEWMKENEVAIEASLRNEIAAEFLEGLRKLFTEHNFNIPEEQVEVVDTMAEKIDELETRLNDAILENAELRKFKEESAKKEVVAKLSEGLTLVESEKLKELSEAVQAEDMEDFQKKVETVKASHFVKGSKTSKVGENLEEINEDLQEKTPENVNPETAKYVQAIKRGIR
jgi:hypothetical protein